MLSKNQKAPKKKRSGFIKKPWGWEYILIETNSVLVSYLSIDPKKSTSLHCHPKKITGYIVLAGEVEVEFLSGTKKFKSGECVNFRPGLFHRTTAVTSGAVVLEIESPPNKLDLLRLEDFSGRGDSTYETELCEFTDEIYSVYLGYQETLSESIRKPQNVLMGDALVSCFTMDALNFVNAMPDELIFSVLDRGIKPKKMPQMLDGNLIDLGNVTTVSILKRMLPVLDFSGEYTFLTVSRDDLFPQSSSVTRLIKL